MPIVASVNIPALNATTTIRNCLRALERQTFPREALEVIVADNGSTDGTPELIRKEFPWVRVVHASPRGSGIARNAAVAASNGRYICTTDADCIAETTWVAELVAALDGASSETLCVGGAILPYRQETIVERYRPAWIRQANLQDPSNRFFYAETPNAAFRRETFERLGFFLSEAGHDDSDMGMRITRSGGRITYAPRAVVRHRNPRTLREFWKQRRKYAEWNVALARRHPEFFAPFQSPSDLQRVRTETVRRLARDVLFAVPRALRPIPGKNSTRIDPLLDGVAAIANYAGVRAAFRKAAVEARRA